MKERVKRAALVTVKSERHCVRPIFSMLTSGGAPATKLPTAVIEASVNVLVLVWATLNVLDWKL